MNLRSSTDLRRHAGLLLTALMGLTTSACDRQDEPPGPVADAAPEDVDDALTFRDGDDDDDDDDDDDEIPTTLALVDSCDFSWSLKASADEGSHRYAERFPIDQGEFEMSSLRFGLIDNTALGRNCAVLPHQVEVWVGDDAFPEAEPELLYSTWFEPEPPEPGTYNRFYTLELPEEIEAEAGESIYVAHEMIVTEQDLRLCMQTCFTGFEKIYGESFWSNADTTPYPWLDLRDFNIPVRPLTSISGVLELDD